MVLEPNFRRYQEPLEASVALMAADDSVDESGMSRRRGAQRSRRTEHLSNSIHYITPFTHITLGSLTLIIALAHSHYRASRNSIPTHTHSHTNTHIASSLSPPTSARLVLPEVVLSCAAAPNPGASRCCIGGKTCCEAPTAARAASILLILVEPARRDW